MFSLVPIYFKNVLCIVNKPVDFDGGISNVSLLGIFEVKATVSDSGDEAFDVNHVI